MALVEPGEIPDFIDDGKPGDLRKSAEQSLLYYQGLPQDTLFIFGQDRYPCDRMTRSMEVLVRFLQKNPSRKELNRFIKKEFLIYRGGGTRSEQPVTFSAYFEPVLEASLEPDGIYCYPLYARPPDLIDVHLELFDPAKKGERIPGRLEGRNLVPYYTREEIDSKKALGGKGLEIAWAKDPVDVLMLQIQGSGMIRCPASGKTYHIRYAGDNGRPYRSVGLHLIETGIIPKHEFTKAKMIQFLASVLPDRRQEVLNVNPRYVFFELLPSTTLTRGSLEVSLTPGRSVASDPKFYPKGALSFIRTARPVFNPRMEFKGTARLSRFVLNQDEGGAIKGTGRIDYFAGGSKEAEKMAERLWYPGELYFFVLKVSSNAGR